MSAKIPSLKTYEYHFRDVTKPHPSSQFGLAPQLPVPPKGLPPKMLNINHRYSHDWHTTLEREQGLVKESKPVLGSERQSQPFAKYTFSAVAAEQKQYRKSQDFQHAKIGSHENQNTGNHQIRKLSKDYSSTLFDKRELTDMEDQREQQNNNKRVIGAAVRKGSKELSDSERECYRLEAELRKKHTENQECKQIVNMLRAEIAKKDAIINNYIQQVSALAEVIANQQQTIVKLCRESQENKKIADLKIVSKVIDHCGLEGEDGDDQFNKYSSNSTITYNYEDDYKQVLQMFGVQPSDQRFHETLVQQIQKVKKSLAELTNRMQVLREKQRENGRLIHYSQKMQSDNIKLANLNSFLSQEITKYCVMLEESNELIQYIHLRQLNERFNQQRTL